MAAGQWLLATTDIRRALPMLREELGPDHFAVAAAGCRLGEALAGQDDLAQAERLLTQSIASQKRAFRGGHRLTADCLSSVAGVQQRAGRLTEAAWNYRRAIHIFESSPVARDPRLIEALRNYERLLRMDRKREARALEGRANALRGGPR